MHRLNCDLWFQGSLDLTQVNVSRRDSTPGQQKSGSPSVQQSTPALPNDDTEMESMKVLSTGTRIGHSKNPLSDDTGMLQPQMSRDN